MKNRIKLFVLSSIFLSTTALAEKAPYTHPGFYTTDPVQVAVNFVSVEGIKNSLKGKPPMTVTFDIDDTVLFSSGYFQYAFTFGESLGFGSNPKEVLHSQKYWDYLAEQADKHSIPKKVAKKLIAMHQLRGDKIVFVTGRTPHSQLENGTVTETAKTLQKYFDLPKDTIIWYTSETPMENYKYDKTYYIKKANSQLHYGDSDSDILAAREAKVRGIRVQRSAASTNPQKMNGGYGEEVIINSDW